MFPTICLAALYSAGGTAFKSVYEGEGSQQNGPGSLGPRKGHALKIRKAHLWFGRAATRIKSLSLEYLQAFRGADRVRCCVVESVILIHWAGAKTADAEPAMQKLDSNA